MNASTHCAGGFRGDYSKPSGQRCGERAKVVKMGPSGWRTQQRSEQSALDLLPKCPSRYAVTTRGDLVTTPARSNGGRLQGPEGLVDDSGVAAPRAMARRIHLIHAMKTLLQQEPLLVKGGTTAEAYKRVIQVTSKSIDQRLSGLASPSAAAPSLDLR